jgi:hypothetical protein
VPLIPQYGCEPVDPPTDCTWLFDIGDRIRLAAVDGLAPYMPAPGSDCAPGFESYVSLGKPPADQCDILGVWLMSYGPTTRSAALQQGMGTVPIEWQTEWSVDLWERCYPGPTESEGTFSLPPPDLLHDINQWTYQHGAAMYQAVVDEVRSIPCSTAVVAPLLPVEPRGGCAGWTFRVVLA